MEISKSGLQSGNPLELLKLAYLLDSQKLKDEFAKVQVTINNEDDLIELAKIAESKLDVSGQIKDSNNNPLMFNTILILSNLGDYSEEQLNEARKSLKD